jgi:hypothetical protein
MSSARDAIMRYNEVGKFFESTVQSLGRTNPSIVDVNRFFVEVYEKLSKETIPMNPTDDKEELARLNALTTISGWQETFDSESYNFGSSMWIAANAVTNHIQHRVATRGRKKTPASAAYNNLIGQNAKDSTQVFRTALQLVS